MANLPIKNTAQITSGDIWVLDFQSTQQPYKLFLPLTSVKVINDSTQSVEIYINTKLQDTIYGLGRDTITNIADMDIKNIWIKNTGTQTIKANTITVSLFNQGTSTEGSYSGTQSAVPICSVINVTTTPQSILTGDTAKSVFYLDLIVLDYGSLTPGTGHIYLGSGGVYPWKSWNVSDAYSWPKLSDQFIHDLSTFQVYCDSNSTPPQIGLIGSSRY